MRVVSSHGAGYSVRVGRNSASVADRNVAPSRGGEVEGARHLWSVALLCISDHGFVITESTYERRGRIPSGFHGAKTRKSRSANVCFGWEADMS